MKSLFALVACLFVLPLGASASPSKSVQSVNCTSPAMLAGGSTIVEGQLDLTLQPSGQFLAEGKLAVSIKSGRRVLYSSEALSVRGIYDNVGGTEYAHLGAVDNADVESLYLNFSESDLSGVEYKGVRYPLNCVN
ncbi:MAG: hypothetical protein IPJ84_10180 [Bdellovibrionales bacterium]|nr:hypothetical protein [Bdellovibrionales bacterium]